MSEFGTKLKQFRERAGLTRSALARAAEVNASYISRLETGERRPSRRDNVLDIERALNLDFDDRNALLIAAGFAPIRLEEVIEGHATVKLLADLLDDERIPQEEKDLIELQLQQINKRWRGSQEP